MGNLTISYAIVVLAVGLASLLAGFLWGRSNLKLKLEQAIEEGASSLDAREFAMRQRLDEAIAEIARLRPLAAELGRVQDRINLEHPRSERMKVEFDASLSGTEEASVDREIPPPEPPMTPASADVAIQKLLQSLEALNRPDSQTNPSELEPGVSEAVERLAILEPLPVADTPQAEQPQPAELPQRGETRHGLEVSPKPAPTEPPRPFHAEPADASQPVDEWQEFARSLAALTGRKQ